jgi:hypothetical protein
MRRFSIWSGVMILLIGAGLRLIALDTLPPGPHYDEAVNVIVTRTIAYGGARPFPMIENFQGREVLYYYVSVPFLTLIHDSRFALQLVGVYSNLILMAATMTLGRLMFGGKKGMWVGLFAGVVAAISLPQVLLSRQAFRAILLPMLQALTLIALWRGLGRQRVLWLMVGGVMGGLTVYTYNSSRLFPVWLAIGGLALIAFSAEERGLRLRQGVAFFVPLTLVALPFAIYGVLRPDIFLGRLYEVTGGMDDITLTESTVRHVRMFFVQGETLLRYNPRGRPYFTWVEGFLLVTGYGAGLWGMLRRRTPPMQRSGYLLVLLSPLMIVPSVISTSGFPPNHMRSIAMVPLIFVAVGLGAEFILRRTGNRAKITLLAAALLAGTFNTARDYFAWATRADLYYETDADLAAASEWVLSQGAESVYIAAQDRYHPTVQVYDLPGVRWLGTDTLFLPAADEATIIFPQSAPPPSDWQGWLEEGATDAADIPTGPDGRPAFVAYRLTSNTSLPLSAPGSTIQNPYLSLVGVYEGGAFPNASVDIMTAWQVDNTPLVRDLTPIVQMEDTLGNVIARAESFSVGTDEWLPGETLLQRIPELRVPVGTPPGIYTLRMTWVERSDDRYLPYTGGAGGVWATVGTLEVLRPNQFPPAADLEMDVRVDVDVADGVRLLGWDRYTDTLRPGERLDLTLHWQATETENRTSLRYEVLLGDIPLETEAPLLDEQPITNWFTGQLMTERLRVTVPRDQAAGTYPLRVTLNTEEVIQLGEVAIEGVARVFDPPQVDERVEIAFDNVVELYGYSLTSIDDELTLKLAWKALSNIDEDYTVFVHVLSYTTNDITMQVDRMPQNNTYPTSLWLVGEYIEDTITLQRPDEPNYLIVGLYNSKTGDRLQTPSGNAFRIR